MPDKLLAPLPDLFLRPDGKRVSSREEWRAHRQYLLDLIVNMQYGGMPPKPKAFAVEPLMNGGGSVRIAAYHIHADGFSFCLQLFIPAEIKGPCPVVLTGDGCYRCMNDLVIDEINRRGMIAAKFNRTELAPDLYSTERTGGLYDVYPGMTFGALSAWAWGYHRAMDALCMLDFVDSTRVAITGHSRGGKTVLLAGATDERFAYINPNNSGAGGSGCYRYHTEIDDPTLPIGERVSEHLSDLMRSISYWFGPEMFSYVDCEENLPFDQHMLKALIAPRVLLQTEALGDTWANPKGTWQTHLAAREAWKLVGDPKDIAIRYRPGGHQHDLGAFIALLDLMQTGVAPEGNYFPEMERIFDWEAPIK